MDNKEYCTDGAWNQSPYGSQRQWHSNIHNERSHVAGMAHVLVWPALNNSVAAPLNADDGIKETIIKHRPYEQGQAQDI